MSAVRCVARLPAGDYRLVLDEDGSAALYVLGTCMSPPEHAAALARAFGAEEEKADREARAALLRARYSRRGN